VSLPPLAKKDRQELMKSIEQEVKDLRDMVKILWAVVIEGKPYKPGPEEWDKVVEALARGDVQPMIDFKRQGGVFPEYVPWPKESRRMYHPRKRAGKPPV